MDIEDASSEEAAKPDQIAVGDSITAVDETAESAFRAEARDRGEAIKAPEVLVADETSTPLPPLEQLVRRIPAEVRETLDELFRAKFVAVRRVSSKALKE
jgi:hypothetical protein